MKNDIHIGTSGYSYAYWKNRFYPENTAQGRWLEYYASQFNTVEVNNTFYRFPIAAQLKKAADRTPPGFRFSVKAHKIITHSKRMKDAGEKVKEYIDVVSNGLEDKLACILFQLPPSYSYSEERLDDILKAVPGNPYHIIEFRHSSWWQQPVYEALAAQLLTFCNVSFPGLPDKPVPTQKVFYQRMHGVPKLFESSYSDEELERLAGNIPVDSDAFVYFNNTTFEAGYTNAGKLNEIIRAK